MGKVVISRTSAIWRYYEFLESTRERPWNDNNLNLCAFVRRIVFGSISLAIKLIVVLVLVLAAVAVVGSMFFVVYWLVAHGWNWPGKDDVSCNFLGVGVVFWVLVIVVAGAFLGFYLSDTGKRWASSNKDGKQNLLLAWLRAKKEKVCPLIELKE